MARKYEGLIGDFREIGRKHCNSCDQEKPLSEFYSRANRSKSPAVERSYSYRCKDCDKAAVRAHSKANTDRADDVIFPDEKRCSRCRVLKPAIAFALNRKKRDGLQTRCLECHRDAKYGLQPGEFDRLLKAQEGACAICRTPTEAADTATLNRSLSVDHNHVNGRVRGLLCQRCNAGLGQFRDDPALLSRAITYVTEGGGAGA